MSRRRWIFKERRTPYEEWCECQKIDNLKQAEEIAERQYEESGGSPIEGKIEDGNDVLFFVTI